MTDRIQEEIMSNWPSKWDIPMVSIRCATYNQEQYIGQALDSFLMQETNFPFEIVVHDDASTDRTADIIREYEKKYPLIIKPIYEKENQYSKRDGSLQRIISEACKGKYIAFCEGDDYWTDENKLQKQVNVLESNSNYTFCHTGFSFFYQKKQQFEINHPVPSISDILNKQIAILDYNRYRVQTNTVLMRSDAYKNVKANKDCFNKRFFMGDTQMWILLLEIGDCFYLEDNTAVYRINDESACRGGSYSKQLRFLISCEEMRLYFFKRLKYYGKEYDKVYDSYLKKCYEYIHIDSSFEPMYPLEIRNYSNYLLFVLKYHYRRLKHRLFSLE